MENEFSDCDSCLDLESNRIFEMNSDALKAHAVCSTKSIDCDIIYGKNISSEESEDDSENESMEINQTCSEYIQCNICTEYIANSLKSTNTICDFKNSVENIPVLPSNLPSFPNVLGSEDSDWEPEFKSSEKHSDECKMYTNDKSDAIENKITSFDALNVACKSQNVAILASKVSSFFCAVDSSSSDEESSNSSDDSDEESSNSSDDSDCDEVCNSEFFDESEFEFVEFSNAIESKTTCNDALNVACKSQNAAVLTSKLSSFFCPLDSSSFDEESSNSSDDSDCDEVCNSEFFDESEFEFVEFSNVIKSKTTCSDALNVACKSQNVAVLTSKVSSFFCAVGNSSSDKQSSNSSDDSDKDDSCNSEFFDHKLHSLLLRVNSEWNEATKNLNGKEKSSSKVSFAPDEELVKTFPVEICERKGEWEMYALERIRFKRRIDQMEKIISPILSEVHRANVLPNLHSNQ
ncbi:PP1c_bdg domain-containing protein [Trichonephila clavata]|uniref:PP1c_bdg domain-containing protein n=1 Tax=Trichonephila clavata TaxID=2740835 RepID=A0A8X6GU38_TRICU|nr:PP1c_bdg domain-containing protein [Trichonephila clavata]